VIAELDSGLYQPARDTSPEQVAVLALHELQLDHFWDAAVLLALASYRRREQAWATLVYGQKEGWEIAEARSDGRIERADYDKFLLGELSVLRAATFDQELSRIAVKVGAPIDAQDAGADVMHVITGNAGDIASTWQTIDERFHTLTAPPPERLLHPQLAAAVRKYLQASVKMYRGSNLGLGLAESASGLLARVPLREFRLASLRRAADWFDATIVRAGLLLYKQSPGAITAALQIDRYPSRSHAAVILGLVADPAHLPALQRGWEAERDLITRLSFAYALFALGEKQHASELEDALRSKEPRVVEHAATLVAWTPFEKRSFASETLLAEILAREDATPLTRLVLIVALRDLSKRQPLNESTLSTVLAAAYALRDHPYALDYISPLIADFEQLNRARVLAAIGALQEPLSPWLARFARVVEASDLPQIERWLDDDKYAAAHAMLVRAAGEIPAEQAQAALEKWLLEYPTLGDTIALTLILRPNADKQRLVRFVARPDLPASAVSLELGFGSAGAAKRLTNFLRSPELQERVSATLAIKLFGSRQHADGLWENIEYKEARYYPNDLSLRQSSLSALINIELNRSGGLVADPSL
jgi:HEAT repeat protein